MSMSSQDAVHCLGHLLLPTPPGISELYARQAVYRAIAAMDRLIRSLIRREQPISKKRLIDQFPEMSMPGAPRWQTALTRSLGLLENNKEYNSGVQMATLDDEGVPRVRTLGSRGLLHPKGCPNLPVFVFSTDVRMEKAPQMRKHPHVEFVWWFRGSSEQYRFSGVARVITSPDVDLGPAGPIQEDTLALNKLGEQGFDWEKKMGELYDEGDDNGLRASLNRPPPGTRIPTYETAKEWVPEVPRLGHAKDDADRQRQEEGLRNYALLLVEPFEVDWCELALSPHQRTKFRRKGDAWEEWPVVP
ncbi:uncharacterized protein C8Q71DRAFT_863264 [Rhodofomes roseus]|uniref:Pyridoxamine 5'-phosphate oxidase Alr4036 family FMN-binding domain-containing protein n=1 Tax=Rhodofomes roseus TaxID=34475 RepID=A0ABQ8JYZ9_9APHY|nr:uncharacterized protein C8Q71DRAFT_863264 [Rhodofomes roseus]KAH9829507.1 hypothetical protein C8Q71DRAFT_863264 [Rhodofomes roseus]